MNEPSNRDEKLLLAMEVYRPDRDDLADPNLAPLADALGSDPQVAERVEQIERFDAAVRAAFESVPVPEGLQARLLQRLAPAGTSPQARVADPLAAEVTATNTPKRQRFSRRAFLGMAGGVAAAAALVVGLLLGLQPQPTYTTSAALDETTALFAGEQPESGNLLTETSPPAGYPFSRDVLRFPQTRWRQVDALLGRSAVAYDLPAVGDARATLYVVQVQVTDAPSFPPDAPAWNTAGCSAAAWQDGKNLYILVVAGDARMYKSYLDLDRGPLT